MSTRRNKLADDLFSLVGMVEESHESKIRALADQGWEAFYREIFGDKLVDGFDSEETDDTHHSDAVSWHWEARIALLEGRRPPHDWFVYFPTWSRGNMKSTLARAMLVTDAMLTYAYGQRGYALVPGGTKNKVKTHASSITGMLASPKVREYCPELSEVMKNVQGRSRGWTANFIETKAGYVFHFIGLEEGVAGANLEGVRPTFILPDDIDNRSDSPVIAETKFRIFTSEVLPSKQANTLIFWAQNLISRMSIRYRVEKQHAVILTNRKPTQAVPAVRGLETERKVMPNGIIKDIVTAGRPTWRGWNLQRVQDEIDTYGLEAFKRECQHEVEQSLEGLMLHRWRDEVHVISRSEFRWKFGHEPIPPSWPKEWVNDWARTKTARHANVAFWRTVSPQSSRLPGVNFYCFPMSFKADAQVEDVAERLLSCLEPGPLKARHDLYLGAGPHSHQGYTWQNLRRDELIRTNALKHANTQLERVQFEREAMANVFPPYVEAVMAKHHVLGGVNSHERDDIRRIFNVVYGLRCSAVNPGKFGGVEQANREFYIDWETDHPFRPGTKGYSRSFLVVPDDDYDPDPRLERDPSGREVLVKRPRPFTDSTSPEALHDDELFRYQMVNWRAIPAALTLGGEIIDTPEKANDDFGNCIQMLNVNGPLNNTSLSPIEELRTLLDDDVMALQAKVEAGEPISRADQQRREAKIFFAKQQVQNKYDDESDDLFAEELY